MNLDIVSPFNVMMAVERGATLLCYAGSSLFVCWQRVALS